mmetsp:Transcript_53099/g.139256  ORF Transcript_53099/g.139256 Transcript_53099/m.139256 type:complete len:298 (-) Transcript_53099:627-1520(-)
MWRQQRQLQQLPRHRRRHGCRVAETPLAVAALRRWGSRLGSGAEAGDRVLPPAASLAASPSSVRQPPRHLRRHRRWSRRRRQRSPPQQRLRLSLRRRGRGVPGGQALLAASAAGSRASRPSVASVSSNARNSSQNLVGMSLCITHMSTVAAWEQRLLSDFFSMPRGSPRLRTWRRHMPLHRVQLPHHLRRTRVPRPHRPRPPVQTAAALPRRARPKTWCRPRGPAGTRCWTARRASFARKCCTAPRASSLASTVFAVLASAAGFGPRAPGCRSARFAARWWSGSHGTTPSTGSSKAC